MFISFNVGVFFGLHSFISRPRPVVRSFILFVFLQIVPCILRIFHRPICFIWPIFAKIINDLMEKPYGCYELFTRLVKIYFYLRGIQSIFQVLSLLLTNWKRF